jgi:hypothetical protein
MRTHREICEIIEKIEKSKDVNSYKLKGVYIWPIIRFNLIHSLFNQNENTINVERSIKPNGSINLFKRAYFKFYVWVVIKLFYKTSKKNVYLTRPGEKRKNILKNINYPFAYSLKRLLGEIQEELFVINTLDPRFKKMLKYSKALVEIKDDDIEVFKKNIENISTDSITGNVAKVYNQVVTVFAYAYLVKQIINENKVKNIFFTVYYDSLCMGASLASSQTGVSSIEIQHGQQGVYSPYDTHFFKVPKEGYALLPKNFWVWGTKSLARKASIITNSHYHNATIMGNIVISYYLRTAKIENKKMKKRKNVLFALQPVEPLYPDNIVELVHELKDTHNFFFRLHPNSLSEKNKLEKHFENYVNVYIDSATSTPLFELLIKMDYVVTKWSSVVYEGNAFGCHGIIIDPVGRDLMRESFDTGELDYVESMKELKKLLCEDKQKSTIEPFIETNYEKIIKNMMDGLKCVD